MITVKQLKDLLEDLKEEDIIMIGINHYDSEVGPKKGSMYVFPLQSYENTDYENIEKNLKDPDNLSVSTGGDKDSINDYIETLENGMLILITHISEDLIDINYKG